MTAIYKPIHTKQSLHSFVIVALLGLWHAFVVPFLDDTHTIGRIAKFIPLALMVGGTMLWVMAKRRQQMPRTAFKLFLLLVVMALYRIAAGDANGALDVVMFFGGLGAFWLLAKEAPLNLHALNTTIYAIVLPGAIIYHRFLGLFANFEFDLLPFMGSDWRVLIRSHHHSAMVGCYLFLVNILLYRSKNHQCLRCLGLMALGLYFVIFSGSRAVLLAVALLSAVIVLRKLPRWLFLVVPIITVTSLYIVLATPMINNFRVGGLTGIMLKLDPSNYDPSAGRAWLWQYHLDLFMHHPWIGSPEAESFRFGDIIDGQRVIASTESFFTFVLARYGIPGIAHLIFFVWCLWKPLSKRRFDAYLWGMLIFVLTMSLSLNATTYSFFSMVGFWMFFSLLQQEPLPQPARIRRHWLPEMHKAAMISPGSY
ncbi:MAG: O-antigen ligase family protein [Caldilineaceae bacterium]